MMKTANTIIAAILMSLPLAVVAEQEERGRLSDGRAFRTDSNGIQLVDHVAELELTIESLTRRLEAAENEVRHKDTLLAAQSQSVASLDASVAADVLNASCPPQPQFICPEQITPQLELLQQKLADSEKINATLQDQKEKDGVWFEETLAARDQEIVALKAKVEGRDGKHPQIAQANSFGISDNARAALKLVNHREIKLPPESSRPAELQLEAKDVSDIKKTLKQELAKTQALLKERDQLFSQFSGTSNGIKIKPTSTHSSNNRTVEQLQKDLENEQSPAILTMMSREIADIGRQISDDIELVKRVGRL